MNITKLIASITTIVALGVVGVGAAVLSTRDAGDKPAAERRPPESSAKPEGDLVPRAAPVTRKTRARQIHKKLDEAIELNVEGITLEGLLKHIRRVSTGPKDHGIPIYVEPAGLSETGVSMDQRIAISVIEPIPIRRVLEMALTPEGLAFAVKEDGLLVIDSRTAIAQRRIEDRLAELESKLDRVLKALENPRGRRVD